MRVLIDDQAMSIRSWFDRISVRFQGRGVGNGSYRVSNANVSLRLGTSLNSVQGSAVTLTVNRETTFEVPEYGVISDEIEFR